MKKQKMASLIDYFEIIVKWRRFILRNVLIVTVAAIVFSLLLVQQFTATATLLPPNLEQNAMTGLISSNISSGLSGLARIGGVLPGVATPSDLFAAIMKSGRIKEVIVKKYDLKKEFKVKTMADASRTLDEITNIEVSPEGIISISVTYKNKYLATDIANSYIEELDKFNTETAMTTGKKYRIFIEQRLNETEDTLVEAEEALRTFQEKHRTIALNTEIESAIETIAKLKSQIILLEVKKGALSSSSQFNNPYLHNINKELRELKRQLSKIEFGGKGQGKNEFGAGFSISFSQLAEVSLEYARLLREVKVQEAIYELLTQQYEQAKIIELKDTPTIQLLDYASPPEKKSYPKRSIIVIIAFFCSFALSIFYVLLAEYFQSESVNKEDMRKVSELIHIIVEDINKILNRIKRLFKK